MLFYAIIPQKGQTKVTSKEVHKELLDVEMMLLYETGIIKKKKERKKTEHTIISHNFRNSKRQNIHVMLSYAKRTPTNQKKTKTML